MDAKKDEPIVPKQDMKKYISSNYHSKECINSFKQKMHLKEA